MDGYNRIKEQYLEQTNKDKPLIEIVRYLMKQPNMNELYLKEEKSLEEMMKFINSKAKDQAINNVAIILDETVFSWAVTYFTYSNEELGITDTLKVTAKPKPKEETDNQLALGI